MHKYLTNKRKIMQQKPYFPYQVFICHKFIIEGHGNIFINAICRGLHDNSCIKFEKTNCIYKRKRFF